MKNLKSLIIIGIIIGGLISIWMWTTITSERKERPTKERKVTPPMLAEVTVAPLTEAPEAPLTEITPAPILVRVFKVKRSDLQDILPAMGTVKGFSEIELRFEVSGRIKAINFREGDEVKEGQPIARLDQREAKLRLEYAESKLKGAEAAHSTVKKRLEVQEGLYRAGAIIKAKFEEAQLETERAKLEAAMVKKEVELAEEELSKTRLLAPKDGVIGSRDVEEGEFVTPQTKIASLMDIETVFVELGIVEKDINKIKLAQDAKVLVDTYPEQQFSGKIERIQPMIEGRSRTLTAKVKIANPEGLLVPGMFARANIVLIELKDALIIPTNSLIEVGPKVTVVPLAVSKTYPLEDIEEGLQTATVELRKVTAGYATADYTQVVSGLNEGDLIIIEAREEIKDGMEVKVTGVEEGTL